MTRNGKCICGAVSFTIRDLNTDFGAYHIPVGVLDDTSGLNVAREYLVDNKIDSLPLACGQDQFDTAAMLKMFAAEQ